MKIICIDASPKGNTILTKNKIYEVQNIKISGYPSDIGYVILCDDNTINSIARNRFIPLEDKRQDILNRILSRL